jgi:hypothetical protein
MEIPVFLLMSLHLMGLFMTFYMVYDFAFQLVKFEEY